MTKSVTCPEELGGLASQVTVDYGQLAHQGRLAAATAEPEEVRSQALCLLDNMGKNYMLVLYEKFNTTSPYYCAPKMSGMVWFAFNTNAFTYIHSHIGQSRSVFFFDMMPLPQGSSQRFYIKQKHPCRSRHSQHLHGLFSKLFCVVQMTAMCGTIALINTQLLSISCI